MRVHRQGGRPRSALHAVAHGAGRHCRPRGGGSTPRRRLRDRDFAVGRLRPAARARPRRRLRPAHQPPRRGQNLSGRPGAHGGQPAPAALGAGKSLWLPVLQQSRARHHQAGPGVFRHRQPEGNPPAGRVQRAGLAGILPAAVRPVPRLGAAGTGAPRRPRRATESDALSARGLSPRPAPAG